MPRCPIVMYDARDHAGGRRAGAALATLAVHAGIAVLLLWGLKSGETSRAADSRLITVDLPMTAPPPPPTPTPTPANERSPAIDRPAPQGKAGDALPREAPQAALPLAPAPAATTAGNGADVSAGAAADGTGSGAGGAGSGQGGTGSGSPAQRIAGALNDSDYPREAAAAGLAGTVGISFRVRTDGGVDNCTVVRSSGAAMLDDLTCRLFTRRFRFRPATDAGGNPVESTLQTSFTWGTRRRR